MLPNFILHNSSFTLFQGSGYCTTIADALALFTPEEVRIVATSQGVGALAKKASYPTEPIPVRAGGYLLSVVVKSGVRATIRVLIWKFLNPNYTRMNALLLLASMVLLALPVVAAPPVVSTVRAAQLAGTKNIEVLYDVSDADGDLLTIAMQVSGDAGLTYTIPATALSGHVGAGVASGANRRIIWNAGADWNGQLVSTAKVRITAFDGTTPPPPPGMVYIPAGPFQMGDADGERPDASFTHQVQVDAFFMERFEVSRELWIDVRTWANGHGYSIGGGGYYGAGHPVQQVNWYDAMLWCNARSEKEALTPCYYINPTQTTILRTADSTAISSWVKWSANGYRLPTEAEWEKAARGGLHAQRYPNGNSLPTENEANIGYSYGRSYYTTPVGHPNNTEVGNLPNGYGLFDMAGNVREWCWDWYDENFYSDASATTNPTGPNSWGAGYRVQRGGAWDNTTLGLQAAWRSPNNPGNSDNHDGFRCVRRF